MTTISSAYAIICALFVLMVFLSIFRNTYSSTKLNNVADSEFPSLARYLLSIVSVLVLIVFYKLYLMMFSIITDILLITLLMNHNNLPNILIQPHLLFYPYLHNPLIYFFLQCFFSAYCEKSCC